MTLYWWTIRLRLLLRQKNNKCAKYGWTNHFIRGGGITKMGQTQIEKIKFTLSLMDDAYWNEVVAHCNQLNKKSSQLMSEFTDEYINLAISQIGILEAKSVGYKQLIENTDDEAAMTRITSENKDRINKLLEQKQQVAQKLLILIDEIQNLVKETDKLGE